MTKKDTIIRAATELFAEKGYRETTTADIRKRAQVAQGTLFYHFNNKEGILLHIFSTMIQDYMDKVEKFNHTSVTGMEGLKQYALMLEDISKENESTIHLLLPHLVPSILQENEETKKLFVQYVETSISFLQTLIEKGIADGSIRAVDPKSTAHFLFAVSKGMNRYKAMNLEDKLNITPTFLEFIQNALAPS